MLRTWDEKVGRLCQGGKGNDILLEWKAELRLRTRQESPPSSPCSTAASTSITPDQIDT